MRLPLALVLLLLLAGCVSEGPVAEGNATTAAGEAPAAAVDDGTRQMATDVGHMPHMHDYWSGRERVTLFDDAIDPGANGDPFMTLGGAPAGQVGATSWRFPDGAIVMEGTGRMELTASWDDPAVTSLAARYRIGAGGAWSDAIPLPNGELIALDVTPAMTDMPHMTTSRWELLFTPAESPGSLMGPFHLRVDIVKLSDIMLFPGHPELFEGKPEKVLHDKDHEHTEVSYAKRAPNLVTQGDFGEKTVAPDELVPMETKAMRIELDIIEASASPGQVAEIRFFYRGADTSYLGHPTVLPLEGSLAEKRLVYQFPVAPEQCDTPYGDESQWLFFVEPATKFTGQEQEPTAGGVTDVSIKYHLKVIAYDHELSEYSKMEGDE